MINYSDMSPYLNGLTQKQKDGSMIVWWYINDDQFGYIKHKPWCVRKIHKSLKSWGSYYDHS